MRLNKLFALIFAAVLSGFVLPVIASTEQDIQALMSKGDYTATLEAINQALEIDKLNEALLLTKGFTLMKLNRLDEAARHYQQIRSVLKNNPEPGNNLGMVFRLQKNHLAAIEVFEETIRNFPNYIPAHINLGDTYVELATLRYQRGFKTTGNVMLQQKASLAGDFERLANTALDNNARRIAEQGVLPTVAVAPEPVPQPAVDPIQEILNKLEAWSDAWMSLDSLRYFSHYAEDFKPENDYTQEVWMQRKQDFMSKSEYIKLFMTEFDIQFDPKNNNLATVTFLQRYVSDSYSENTRKQMLLRKNKHGWLIVEEINIRR